MIETPYLPPLTAAIAPAPQPVKETQIATGDARPTAARTIISSVVWTTVLFFVMTFVPMWLLTGQVIEGLGFGAFSAFWGGPGFGLMVGGSIWSERRG